MSNHSEIGRVLDELTPDRIREWTNAMKGFKPLSLEQMRILAEKKGHLYASFKDIQNFFKAHKDLPKARLVKIIRDRQIALRLRPNCNLWKLNGIRQFLRVYEAVEKPETKPLSGPQHRIIRDMVHEIGELEGKISEREYPFDHWYLDVVWKRIKTGLPTHAFEVQIRGNFYEALTKLKHAFDKWNCAPVLITTEKYQEEAKQLLEGSFHEMKETAKIIDWRKIQTLHDLERRLRNIKNEIGL
jgi:hypothetical protein